MRQYPERLGGGPGVSGPSGPQLAVPQPNDQYTALQILTMAQRTAEEHVATARREAEHIRAEARAGAGKIIAEAQAQAGALREEAERTLGRARASAERTVRESEELANQTEQDASGILSDARGRAEEIVQEAQVSARDVKNRAQQIYEDVVGGLTVKRETLQQQIEALEHFEREYRGRLSSFMQQQLRALWVDQPQAPTEIDMPDQVVAELLPAPRDDAEDDQDADPDE
jgi:cell division septum initiation protein DivIVA